MISLLGSAQPLQRACSRSGCASEADWAIVWRNPKIHSADRRKVWLACNEHVDYLKEFLAARSFPLELLPIAELASESEPSLPSGFDATRAGADT